MCCCERGDALHNHVEKLRLMPFAAMLLACAGKGTTMCPTFLWLLGASWQAEGRAQRRSAQSVHPVTKWVVQLGITHRSAATAAIIWSALWLLIGSCPKSIQHLGSHTRSSLQFYIGNGTESCATCRLWICCSGARFCCCLHSFLGVVGHCSTSCRKGTQCA